MQPAPAPRTGPPPPPGTAPRPAAGRPPERSARDVTRLDSSVIAALARTRRQDIEEAAEALAEFEIDEGGGLERREMKPGERVDVRTPNAVAGVRGTVLIVEALRNTSTVTVLRGLVDVVTVRQALEG